MHFSNYATYPDNQIPGISGWKRFGICSGLRVHTKLSELYLVIKPLPTIHRVLDFILSTKYLGGREDDILERHLSGLSEISHLLGEVS